MSALLNLYRQVRSRLGLEHGGTGNALGLAQGSVLACLNRTGSSLPIGTLVEFTHQYNDARVQPVAAANATSVLGVVVGTYRDDDAEWLLEEAAPDGRSVAVQITGMVRVLIGTGDATRGEFAFAAADDGTAQGAAAGIGAFGVFQSSGTSGGTALVLLWGAVSLASGTGVTYGTPALTLGTANAAGSIDQAIRRDATILAFDATNPAALGTAAPGNATVAARRNHVHPMPALDDLTDVGAASPATGDLLAWSGSAWVNQAPASTTNIWRPVMGYNGTDWQVIVGSDGTALMGFGPA